MVEITYNDVGHLKQLLVHALDSYRPKNVSIVDYAESLGMGKVSVNAYRGLLKGTTSPSYLNRISVLRLFDLLLEQTDVTLVFLGGKLPINTECVSGSDAIQSVLQTQFREHYLRSGMTSKRYSVELGLPHTRPEKFFAPANAETGKTKVGSDTLLHYAALVGNGRLTVTKQLKEQNR